MGLITANQSALFHHGVTTLLLNLFIISAPSHIKHLLKNPIVAIKNDFSEKLYLKSKLLEPYVAAIT